MSKASALKYDKFSDWLFHLDRILRGEATKPADIKKADIKMPLMGIAFLVFLLAAIYAVSYTHLRAHETLRYLVCRLLLEKKK